MLVRVCQIWPCDCLTAGAFFFLQDFTVILLSLFLRVSPKPKKHKPKKHIPLSHHHDSFDAGEPRVGGSGQMEGSVVSLRERASGKPGRAKGGQLEQKGHVHFQQDVSTCLDLIAQAKSLMQQPQGCRSFFSPSNTRLDKQCKRKIYRVFYSLGEHNRAATICATPSSLIDFAIVLKRGGRGGAAYQRTLKIA